MRGALTAVLLFGCSGDLDDPPPASVTITHAHVVDHGYGIRGVVVASITAGAKGGAINLWAGAMPNICADRAGGDRRYPRLPCRYQGWLLELPEGTDQIVLAPNETREMRWEVQSGNRSADGYAPLASCGEDVTIVVVPEIDGARGGAFATSYGCALSLLMWR